MINQSEQYSDDLAILLTGATRVVTDRLGAAVERSGVSDMRPSFGFVLRALAERERSPSELAVLLGVSKQRVTKVVDEMEERGFVQRSPDRTDRRRMLIELTAKSQRVRKAALAESHLIEQELRAEVGDTAADAMRRCLHAMLDGAGQSDAALAGRSRALW